jgi:hypothetical protein
MPKLILSDVQNLENSDTAKQTINNNNTRTSLAMEKTLSRDGEGPNHMAADLDMNSQRILNLPFPLDPTEPIRKKEFDQIEGISDIGDISNLVDQAEAAAQEATDQAALAKKWATNPVDVPVTTPPDEFSARHWAIKAQQAVITATAQKEILTADKIWFVSLNGSDTTGDGTFANPWYSVTKAHRHIMTNVNCNGFAPVIQMADGTYVIGNDGEAGIYTGFTPPGFLTWGGFPNTPVPGQNVVAHGGALLEMCESIHGAQVTGGQPIRLCSYDPQVGPGPANRTGDKCIIHTTRLAPGQTTPQTFRNTGISPISILHGGKLIISSMTFRASTVCNLIYATHGGSIEIGNNVHFAGNGVFVPGPPLPPGPAEAGALMYADVGGTIIVTGNIQLSATPGHFFAVASGTGATWGIVGAVDLQYKIGGYIRNPNLTNEGSGPHHAGTAFVLGDRGGQITWGGRTYRTIPAGEVLPPPPNDNTYGQSYIHDNTVRYMAHRGGAIIGAANINAIQAVDFTNDNFNPGQPGQIAANTFAWSL